MALDQGALIPLGGQAPQIERGGGDEYARELFRSLRVVFDANRLSQRVIFWVEEKSGFWILRYVPDPKRERKREDWLVSQISPDLTAAKILIGNYAAGCALTAVRWELYGDFELHDRLAFGRFDGRDLLGDASEVTLHRCEANGVTPRGSWDFD